MIWKKPHIIAASQTGSATFRSSHFDISITDIKSYVLLRKGFQAFIWQTLNSITSLIVKTIQLTQRKYKVSYGRKAGKSCK
jgi:hypothetical protein